MKNWPDGLHIIQERTNDAQTLTHRKHDRNFEKMLIIGSASTRFRNGANNEESVIIWVKPYITINQKKIFKTKNATTPRLISCIY